MTFFLQEAPRDAMQPRVPKGPVSTLGQGLGAATTAAAIENDANFKTARTRVKARDDLAAKALERLGIDAIAPLVERQNQRAIDAGLPEQVRGVPKTAAEAIEIFGPNFSKSILDIARDTAKRNPDQWSDLDLSEDAIEAETNARLQAEYQDAQDILEMMPSGHATAGLVGGMVGVTADVKNLPFLLLGGGSGSFMRIMGREAMINAGAEAAFLPSQFDMAERLEIEDPNVLQQLALAAGAGAILGGAFEALGRGLRYVKGRAAVDTPLPGYDAPHTRAMVDEAEDILASGRADALAQIARIPDRTPKEPPFKAENPANPERPPLVPEIEESVLPPADLQDEITTVQALSEEARNRDTRASKPLVDRLTQSPKKGGEDLRIHPDGAVGQELKAMGINSRSAPGLFSRQGRKSLDNLVADEWDDLLPGIKDEAGVSSNGYLDQQGLIAVLARDIEGDSTWLRSRAEAAALDREIMDIERGTIGDYQAKEPVEGGLFIDRDAFLFDVNEDEAMAAIESSVRRWIDENGFGDILTDAEKREIIGQLQKDGGEVDYLVERVLEREADFVDAPEPTNAASEEIPFGEPVRTDGQGAGQAGPVTGEAGGGAAGEAGRAGDAGAQFERTAAGDQSVAPGIAPVSPRQRLEAAQDAPLRGGNAAADDGLFDMGARLQGDMFDDMTSPAAKTRMETVSTDLRTDIEKSGDFAAGIPSPEGRTLSTASETLDYLDDLDDFAEIIQLCGKKPT